MVPVGDDELELDRLQVVGGIRFRAERSEHREQRVRLAELTEDGSAQSRRVDEPDRRRGRLRGALDLGDRLEPFVRDGRDPDVLLAVGGRRRCRSAL